MADQKPDGNSSRNKGGTNVPQSGNVLPQHTKPGFTANTRPDPQPTPPPQDQGVGAAPETPEPPETGPDQAAAPQTAWDKFKNFMNQRLDTPEGKAGAKSQMDDFKSKLMWGLAGIGLAGFALWKFSKPHLGGVANGVGGIFTPIKTFKSGGLVQKLTVAELFPIWGTVGAAKKTFIDAPSYALRRWGIRGLAAIGVLGFIGYKVALDTESGRDTSKVDSALGNAVSLYHKAWRVAGQGATQVQDCTNNSEDCTRDVTGTAASGLSSALDAAGPVGSAWWNYVAKPYWETQASLAAVPFTSKTLPDVGRELQSHYSGALHKGAKGDPKSAFGSVAPLSNNNPDNTWVQICQPLSKDLQKTLGDRFLPVTRAYWKALEQDFDAQKRNPNSDLMRALQAGKHFTITLPPIEEFNARAGNSGYKPEMEFKEFKTRQMITCYGRKEDWTTYNGKIPHVSVTDFTVRYLDPPKNEQAAKFAYPWHYK